MKPRERSAGSRQGGFSILEVLVATLLISIGASVLVMSARTSKTGQARSKVYGDAVTAAKEVLEELHIMSLADISRLNGVYIPHSQDTTTKVLVTVRGVRATDVGNFGSLDTASLRYVTLRVRFISQAKAQAEKVFTTILYKP
ncbi:MAG: prepilin-type N-terminal cleavage/methylation domain-containing protein [Fibrobacteria bacterium]